MKIKIGSRESLLAMTQTKLIIDEIKKSNANIEFEIIPIKTIGDKILNISLNKIGGKGLFINELEKALLNKDIDMAVHSMKDIPINIGDGLLICAYSKREDARDVLISNKYNNIEDMIENSTLGTSSSRREIQVMNINPKLNIKLLRGNVITRINKLDFKQYDAIILAMAGLKRLHLENRAKYIFSTHEIIPGICQGILGIEIRENDNKLNEILKCIDDKSSRQCALAERAFMKTLEGSCSTPMGAYAQIKDNIMSIEGFYHTTSTSYNLKKYTVNGDVNYPEILGIKLAQKIIS